MAEPDSRAIAQALKELDWSGVPARNREVIEQAIFALERGTTPAFVPGAAVSVRDDRCWCETCCPITLDDMRMVLCPECGNKRCPHATDHRHACTGSNEPGQKGSSWEHVKPAA